SSTTVPVAVLVLSKTRMSRIFCGQLDCAHATPPASRIAIATTRDLIRPSYDKTGGGISSPKGTVTGFAMTGVNASCFRRDLDDVAARVLGGGRSRAWHDPALSPAWRHSRSYHLPAIRWRRPVPWRHRRRAERRIGAGAKALPRAFARLDRVRRRL